MDIDSDLWVWGMLSNENFCYKIITESIQNLVVVKVLLMGSTLCGQNCPWLGTCRQFSTYSTISATNKSERHGHSVEW